MSAPVPASEPDLLELAHAAVDSAEALLADATGKLRAKIACAGRIDSNLLDREQRAAHGLAWLATYVEALRQLASYAERMQGAGRLGETEELLVRIGMGEYLAQIVGGIPMSQGEIVRLRDLGLSAAEIAGRMTPAVEELIDTGNTAEHRARAITLLRSAGDQCDPGLDD